MWSTGLIQKRCNSVNSDTSTQIWRSKAHRSIHYLLQIPLTGISYSRIWLAADRFWVLDDSNVHWQDPYKTWGKKQSGIPLTLMHNAQNPILTICFLDIVSRLQLPVIIHHHNNKNIRKFPLLKQQLPSCGSVTNTREFLSGSDLSKVLHIGPIRSLDD